MTALAASTFVVVPVYNEAAVLADVIHGLIDRHPELSVVVVDDGSTDGTADVASHLSVHYLRHVVNLGQGAALRTGIEYALTRGAEVIVTFDADGQMQHDDLTAVVDPVALEGYDVALGTRFAAQHPEGISFVRRMILRAGLFFTRVSTGLALTDAHNGFRAFSRKAAEQMELSQDRMAHASEIVHEIARLKLRWKEVPVRIRYTPYSRSKGQSSWGAVDILLDLVSGRR